MNTQKGIAPIILIVAAFLLATGFGGYFFIFQQGSSPEITEEQEQSQITEEAPVLSDNATEEANEAVLPLEKTNDQFSQDQEDGQASPTQEPAAVKETPKPIAQNQCSRLFSPQFNAGSYYTDHLFDAHFHMPNLIDFSALGGHDAELAQGHAVDRDVLMDSILCRFKEENVQGAIGFTIGFEEALAEIVAYAYLVDATRVFAENIERHAEVLHEVIGILRLQISTE